MRVNVQLIDTESGSHLWGERFDKPVIDLLDMQDEIVSSLANRLGLELAAAEARRAEHEVNPDSRDHYFLGLAQYNKGITAEIFDNARTHYDQAIELDQNNVEALIGRTWIDLISAANYLSNDRVERLRSAEARLGKVLKLGPNNANAHCALGVLRMYTNRAAQSIAECERALAIDRNLAVAHAWIGLAKFFAGRNEETEGHVLEALRISPRDPRASGWMHFVGAAKLGAGHDEEAVAWLNRSIELGANWPSPHLSSLLPSRDLIADEARDLWDGGARMAPPSRPTVFTKNPAPKSAVP